MLVSDVSVFVLKIDVKLQPTNLSHVCLGDFHVSYDR